MSHGHGTGRTGSGSAWLRRGDSRAIRLRLQFQRKPIPIFHCHRGVSYALATEPMVRTVCGLQLVQAFNPVRWCAVVFGAKRLYTHPST
jgi:hypothetical protein